MSHVFVTGAGGFIGGVVARALAVAGHRVSALHRGPAPTGLAAAGVTAIQGDLREPTRFPERYDALIHAGAVIPARNTADNDFAAVNIAATEALLAQAGAAGATRVIFCSSMSVYGRVTAPVVAVDTPPREVDDYGRSKQAGEAALTTWVAGAA
ncbi:MAG: NAD-dependent epimerase/dehydratase family protein, partial [Thalassobaculaceae bacterium]